MQGGAAHAPHLGAAVDVGQVGADALGAHDVVQAELTNGGRALEQQRQGLADAARCACEEAPQLG
jgi:hypothetical protein